MTALIIAITGILFCVVFRAAIDKRDADNSRRAKETRLYLGSHRFGRNGAMVRLLKTAAPAQVNDRLLAEKLLMTSDVQAARHLRLVKSDDRTREVI